MRVTNVRVFNSYTEDPLILAFRDPTRQEPYQVTGITGLDADEINRKFVGTGASGQKFYDFALKTREVSVQMSLNPQWSTGETYSDLRDLLWRIVHSSRTGNVVLGFYYEDEAVAFVSGYVTKMEPDLFTDKPSVTMTMECPDPMLRSLFPRQIDVSEFETAESTVTDEESTAPHGMTFSLTFNADADSILIGEEGEWSFEIEPDGGFEEDDVLHCSSEVNQKELFIMRGETRIELADVIAADASWPLIFPGPNTFEISGADVSWTTLGYYLTYWGV